MHRIVYTTMVTICCQFGQTEMYVQWVFMYQYAVELNYITWVMFLFYTYIARILKHNIILSPPRKHSAHHRHFIHKFKS